MIDNVVANYKIVEKLGEGGMGAVYKAIDFMAAREVAIKMLRPEFARQSHVVARFRSEAKALAKLNHPNIATGERLHPELRTCHTQRVRLELLLHESGRGCSGSWSL